MTEAETIPQTMINAVTGESHVIQLTPREGLTAAEAEAFLANRKEAGKAIDLENCEVFTSCVNILDPYGLFHVPEEWTNIGDVEFVRNRPDGVWVSRYELPEEIRKAVDEKKVRAARSVS
jgi:hypothetical protein